MTNSMDAVDSMRIVVVTLRKVRMIAQLPVNPNAKKRLSLIHIADSANAADTEPFCATASPEAVCRPITRLLTTFKLPLASVRDSPLLPVKLTTCILLEASAATRDAAAVVAKVVQSRCFYISIAGASANGKLLAA